MSNTADEDFQIVGSRAEVAEDLLLTREVRLVGSYRLFEGGMKTPAFSGADLHQELEKLPRQEYQSLLLEGHEKKSLDWTVYSPVERSSKQR